MLFTDIVSLLSSHPGAALALHDQERFDEAQRARAEAEELGGAPGSRGGNAAAQDSSAAKLMFR